MKAIVATGLLSIVAVLWLLFKVLVRHPLRTHLSNVYRFGS